MLCAKSQAGDVEQIVWTPFEWSPPPAAPIRHALNMPSFTMSFADLLDGLLLSTILGG